IAMDHQDNFLVTGVFGTDFSKFGHHELRHHGNGDMFIAKLSNPTSVKDQFPEEKLSIFPNPARDFLHIELKEHEFEEVLLLNTAGQILHRQRIKPSQNRLEIPLKGYAAGMYLLQTKGAKVMQNRKIIIHH